MIGISFCLTRTAFSKVYFVQDFAQKAHFVRTTELWVQSRMLPKQKSTKDPQKSTTGAATEESPVELNSNNTVTVKILAKPGAKHNSITDFSSEGVGIQISAPPVDGEANTELVKFLASVLGLRKSELSLEKGWRSRHKSVVVSGGLSREEILSRLKSEMEK